jgi:hypothetical protein
MSAPADWRSEVESVRKMIDGLRADLTDARAERDEARAQIAAVTAERETLALAAQRTLAIAKVQSHRLRERRHLLAWQEARRIRERSVLHASLGDLMVRTSAGEHDRLRAENEALKAEFAESMEAWEQRRDALDSHLRAVKDRLRAALAKGER